MLKINLSTLGNQIVFKEKIDEQTTVKKYFTIFGESRFDQLIIQFLNFLSFFFPDCRPLQVELNHFRFTTTLSNIRQIVVAELISRCVKANIPHHHRALTKNVDDCLDNLCGLFLHPLIDQCFNNQKYDAHVKETELIKSLMQQSQPKIGISFDPYGKFIFQDCANARIIVTLGENITVTKPEHVTNMSFYEEMFFQLLSPGGRLHSLILKTPGSLKEKLEAAYNSLVVKEYNQFVGPFSKDEIQNTKILVGDKQTRMHKITLDENKYIAAPLYENTGTSEFWNVVFNEKSPVIVKLSSEQPIHHRPLYWPNKIGMKWETDNGISVTCESIEYNEDLFLNKRKFLLQKGEEKLSVTQLDFLGWMDMNVPNSEALKKLLKLTEECRGSSDAPLLVHCLAGQGRTGTFIAAHHGMKLIEKGKKPNYCEIIKSIRQQRSYQMVETSSQYVFLHRLFNL